MVTLVTCEETGRVAFFLWVCAMFLTMCGFFTMVPTLVMAVFGSRHFNVNMGLIETNGVSDAFAAKIKGAGCSSVVGRRTRDRKVAGSIPGRSGGRIFFSRVHYSR